MPHKKKMKSKKRTVSKKSSAGYHKRNAIGNATNKYLKGNRGGYPS